MCMWVACQASRAECLTTAGPSFRHTGISSYPPDCMGFPQPGNRFPPFRWPSQEGLTMDLSTLQSCKAMSARFPFRTRRTRSRSFMNRIVSPAHSRHSPHPPIHRRPADRLSQDDVRRIIGGNRTAGISLNYPRVCAVFPSPNVGRGRGGGSRYHPTLTAALSSLPIKGRGRICSRPRLRESG